jgi:hypothetical protein
MGNTAEKQNARQFKVNEWKWIKTLMTKNQPAGVGLRMYAK